MRNKRNNQGKRNIWTCRTWPRHRPIL